MLKDFLLFLKASLITFYSFLCSKLVSTMMDNGTGSIQLLVCQCCMHCLFNIGCKKSVLMLPKEQMCLWEAVGPTVTLDGVFYSRVPLAVMNARVLG